MPFMNFSGHLILWQRLTPSFRGRGRALWPRQHEHAKQVRWGQAKRSWGAGRGRVSERDRITLQRKCIAVRPTPGMRSGLQPWAGRVRCETEPGTAQRLRSRYEI